MKRLLSAILTITSFACSGQAYFQQRSDTKIAVTLDDRKHFLRGFETIRYTNNSPDTLRYIYLHLWPNAYTSDRTRFAEQQVKNRSTAFYFSKPISRGFIDSLDIRIDGQPTIPVSADGMPDVARIDLPAPLATGASIDIQTPFRVKIPLVFSRMGHNGQAYYISQWFPKPAVYDRKGWHPLSYSDQGEFFSEIGSYDVSITLPKNYVVMATGNCLNEEENRWLDSLSSLPHPEETIPVRHSKHWRDIVNKIPPSSKEWKTLNYHEDNVHDFAWFADKRFLLRKDTVHVAAGATVSAHDVTIYAAALPSEDKYWARATEYMKKTIRYLSEHVGPYPYNTVKAVEGDLKAGGGMEYPTVTVIDRLATLTSVMQTLVHEVGHNWFYGVLATNERDEPWMDEGVNTFYEQTISRGIRLPMGAKERYTNRIEDVLYYNAASTANDQNLNTTSARYTKGNYGLDVYYKAALLLNWLQGYMGKDTFETAMKDYYNTWQYRHPYPEDMQAVFQHNLKRPVGWFFDGALNTEKGIDFAIKRVHTRDGLSMIRVKNSSNFAAPVRVNAYRKGEMIDSVWSLPFAKDTTLRMTDVHARLWSEGREVPDYYGFNNEYHRQGLFRDKTFKIRGGVGLGRREAAEMYILPAVGYNVYDGFMAGILLHNLTIPQNRFRYALASLYGFRSHDFVGTGSVGYWIYPSGMFKEIVPQVDLKSFHYDTTSLHIPSLLKARYIKVAPSLSFVWKNESPLSTVTRTLMLKGYAIWEDTFTYNLDPVDSFYKASLRGSRLSNYGLVRYTHVNNRTFNPFSYVLEGQVGSTFSKISAEGKLRIDYNVKNKGLYLRFYAGKFFAIGNSGADNSRYLLTTTYTAANDYLYDGTYIGRSEREGFASRQLSIQEGGGKFATPLYGIPLGQSDDWLASINLKTDLPLGMLPVRLYLDIATYANAEKINPSLNRFLYTGGIEFHALHDLLLVHIPLFMSSDYSDYLTSLYPGRKFANSISFAIQFQNINWLRTVSSGMKMYLN